MGNPGADILHNGFRIDEVTVEPNEGLIRGPGGVEEVDPKVMAVMVELAREPGRLVLREELLERVWQTTHISDDVLSRCIYWLRKHLEVAGGSSDWHDQIITLPRRGYRLQGPVEPIESEAVTASADADRSGDSRQYGSSSFVRSVLLFVLLALLLGFWWQVQRDRSPPTNGATEPTSIVVLPFSDYGDGRRDEFLGHGIADSLITLLARSQPNRVIARSSAFALAADSTDSAEIGERLGVSHLVEGSLRRDGDQFSVSVQLVDAATAATLWADRWEVPLSELTRFEQKLANTIAEELGWNFRVHESAEPLPIEAGDAYVGHLHARHLMHRRYESDLEQAITLFERAVTDLPGLADAWAGLASAAWLRAENMPDTPKGRDRRNELMEKARQAGERALALEPDHAEALLRMSRIALGVRDIDRAKSLYLRARRIAPNDPTLLAMDASIAFLHGEHDTAIRLLELSLARDPLAAAYRANLVLYLHRAGRSNQAEEEALRVIGLTDGAVDDHMRVLLVEIAINRGQFEGARVLAEAIKGSEHRAYAEVLLYSATDVNAAARDALERLDDMEGLFARIHHAEAFAFRGDDSAALKIVQDLAHSNPQDSLAARVMFLSNISASRNLARLRDHPDWPASALQVPSWVPPPRGDAQPESRITKTAISKQ